MMGLTTPARFTNDSTGNHPRGSWGNPLQRTADGGAERRGPGEKYSSVACLQSTFSPVLMISLKCFKLLLEKYISFLKLERTNGLNNILKSND